MHDTRASNRSCTDHSWDDIHLGGHLFTMISPVDLMPEGYWVKREDLACWSDPLYPSGSKVRQYLTMASRHAIDVLSLNGTPIFYDGASTPPCIVGCSANSAMQIYVAATAHQLKTKGYIYTASRKFKTDATLYAERLGAEIVEVKPGYLSVIRREAKNRAMLLGKVVEWDRHAAVLDTVNQCENIPTKAKRIIIPTGSGLTAAGVIVGLTKFGMKAEVVAIATSMMADEAKIKALATKHGASPEVLDRTKLLGPKIPYDTPIVARLSDGTPLDPFYAAKAFEFVQEGDVLWPPGLRPVCSMPQICQEAFNDWNGPK